MSINATNWAWKQTLPPTDKLVLMAICDCHNASSGQCNPSYEFISEKACVSRITAIRSVRKLSDEGYISTLTSREDSGRQRVNSYLINSDEAEYHSDTPGRVSFKPEPGIICDTHKEHGIEHGTNQSKARARDGTRVPERFTPNETSLSEAKKLNFTQEILTDRIKAFIDYWIGVPGARGKKLDWDATFRNHLRDYAAKFSNRMKSNGTHSPSKPNTIAHSFEVIDAAIAERERQLDLAERGESDGGKGFKLLS